MLLGIHIKNLALIDEIEINFGEHLNILTGETGAGKSIMIGSVNLALGGKAAKDMIRQGAEDALVELFFKTEDKVVLEKLNQMDIPWEDGHIIITRRIMPTRSVCRINGEIVSAKSLSEISSSLIDIHGQHDHQSLLYKHKHLDILDDFSKEKLGHLKKDMAEAYKEYTKLCRQLNESNQDEEQRRRAMDFAKFELEEINNAHLTLGEDEQLEAQYKKMVNGKKITEGTHEAHQLTSTEASEAVSRALRSLYPMADEDKPLADLVSQLEDIENLLSDFNRELADYEESLVFDRETFDSVEQRLDLINGLKAKYGQTLEDILAYGQAKEQELDQLAHYEEYLEKLTGDTKEAKARYEALANQVSQIRHSQSVILAKEIENALKDLNFLDVNFQLEIIDSNQWTQNGKDEAQFIIATNPGESLKPLSQVASGGELSRIMLAIKSVLADADAIETLIFDEIDTGISGRTAQKVSERLAVISDKHQVICISHLPQIASMADNHYVIEKQVVSGRTVTDIRMLSKDKSAEEIARMLGGVEITETVLENAKEMKKLAEKMKKYKI